jgi:hypothetical protein
VSTADAGQRVQAVRAILARTSETVDENLPDEVRDVVRVEGSWHESCVPAVPPTMSSQDLALHTGVPGIERS